MGTQEYVKISGCVEEIIYKNEDTGFCVLDISVDNELICAVGTMVSVEPGEELELTGYFDTHPVHGEQFKVQMVERRLPATSSAIRRYLSSGVVKGIGPATARNIVNCFGDDTLKIIEESPMRLAEVPGISAAKAQKLAGAFAQVFGVRTLMMFLSKYQITPMQSVAIYKEWGTGAMDLIKQNPYILSRASFGISFATADAMALAFHLPPENEDRILAGIQFVLKHNTANGHTGLPLRLLLPTAARMLALSESVVEDTLVRAVESGELYRMEDAPDLIFLPEYYMAQQNIVSRLSLMLSVYREPQPQIEDAISLIEEEKGICYESLQRKAIAQAAQQPVFILTGGPGTGKTTTVNGMIELFEQQGKTVLLTAPTGRAAKRMTEVTGREAKTIHRLLEVEPGYAQTGKLIFSHNEQNPLYGDVVIVDEVSMVDTLLFDALLRGMKPTAKLVLVGDFHQLPSVGAGNVLRDLIESDCVPTVSLTQIFRQAAKSLIVTNAHAIVNGQMPELSKKDNDFFFLPQSDTKQAAQLIADLCATRLPHTYGFSPTEDIQVLCPQRKRRSRCDCAQSVFAGAAKSCRRYKNAVEKPYLFVPRAG